jgi:hypothetical protein
VTRTLDRTCRAAGDARLVNLEHLRDCNASGCPGCLPCTPEHGHCTRCGVTHLDAQHPRTCPSCVGKVRNDILEIERQIGEAHTQFIHRSVASIAFMVNGPAANYEAGSYVHQSATSGRLCKCAQRGMVCPAKLPDLHGPMCERCSHETCRALRRPRVCPDAAFILEEIRADELHPLTVLGAWEFAWRRHLGHDEPDDSPTTWSADARTTWSAASYLLTNLTYMAQLEDAGFDEFADEVTRSRSWLEDVLRTGNRPERGVKCPVCGKADLEKAYDTTDEKTQYEPGRETKVYDDLWICPRAECAQTWTDDEYQTKVQGIYLGVADRLTAAQIREQYRVPEGSVRGWAAKGQVRKRGRDASGRQLYDVAEVLALRDGHQRTTAS